MKKEKRISSRERNFKKKNHQITEYLKLERPSACHLVLPPHPKQVQLDKVAQTLFR